MPILDIFNNDAFSHNTLMGTVDNIEFLPTRLGGMNIFTPRPIRTEMFSMESRDGVLSLIQTSPRGAPIEQATKNKRNLRNFGTTRIAKGVRLTASELQFLRQYGEEQAVVELQGEIARHLSGAGGLSDDVALTKENMRLGAIQGIVLDADGSELTNWFTEWGVSPATEIDFDLDNASPASGALRKKCVKLIRQMSLASAGAWSAGTRVHALCGDAFYDDLVAHPELREVYLNRRDSGVVEGGAAYETVTYGGITFENYRGTDDGSTVSIGTDKAKFFPVNTPNVFQEVKSPSERFEDIGTLGRDVYPLITRDQVRDQYVDIELYSYPMYVCTRPKMLQSGRRT